MTGKQLKAFAAQVHDDAIIETREKSYYGWVRPFEMQAPYIYKENPTIEAFDHEKKEGTE